MQANKKSMSKPIRVMFCVFFIIYLFLLAYLTFFSQIYGRTVEHRSISIIPMHTITEFLTKGYGTRAIITNLAGNIIAFMPMGFLLPIAFQRLDKFHKVLIISLLASITIEILQYIAGVGVSDIDDVILNVFGAAAGYCVYWLASKLIY